MNVLNKNVNNSTESNSNLSALQVASLLQLMILKLKGKYLSENGKSVDYAGLRTDDVFGEFEELARQLTSVNLNDLNNLQRKAFFINVYNTLTIHGLCKVEPLPSSVTEVKHFWKETCYEINGLVFSLDDIEHGVLRGNSKHPSGIMKPFTDSDPRLKFSMDRLDARIHFALNCGAKSCPAIAVYNENNLESGLSQAAVTFLGENLQIVNQKEIHLSKIFQWYGSDFGSNEAEILKWISQFLNDDLKSQIDLLLKSGKFKIVFEEYDWLLNVD